jgi:tetratricopeptide (TPR) repeat protein
VLAGDQRQDRQHPLYVSQGQYPAAISHLKRVLEISEEMRDHVGDADAYGTIADIYTDMGDFDAAATCALS